MPPTDPDMGMREKVREIITAPYCAGRKGESDDAKVDLILLLYSSIIAEAIDAMATFVDEITHYKPSVGEDDDEIVSLNRRLADFKRLARVHAKLKAALGDEG